MNKQKKHQKERKMSINFCCLILNESYAVFGNVSHWINDLSIKR